MQITFHGREMHLTGNVLSQGDQMPDFKFVKNDLAVSALSQIHGKKILLSLPSIDTGICSLEVETFMNYMRASHDAYCISISMDLPFALDRWCQTREQDRVITVSDQQYKEFAKVSGLYIEELGLLARAVYVLDDQNKIVYDELVAELSKEPNYDAALNALGNV